MLSSREEIVTFISDTRLNELLHSAAESGMSDEEADAAREARLQAALQSGDNLVYARVPGARGQNPPDLILVEHATLEAIYFLKRVSKAGASDEDRDDARERRMDLEKLRTRKQSLRDPSRQRLTKPAYVESGSPFSMKGMKGYL